MKTYFKIKGFYINFVGRLRDALTKEICLIKQALEWGEEATPAQHWDQLVAIRGALCDLNHNLLTLFSKKPYCFEKIYQHSIL